MIRLAAILLAAVAVTGCATHCERDTPNFGQPNYDGIGRAQEGCRTVSRRAVQAADLQSPSPRA